MSETEDCTSELPSILIDPEILSSTLKIIGPQRKSYCIGNEVFYEEPKSNLNNNYVEFKLHASRRTNIDKDFVVGKLNDEERFVWTPDGSSDNETNDDEGFMDIHIKEMPKGVIINSNVYLTSYQWHTIIQSDVINYCFICDEYVSSITLDHHLNGCDHNRVLQSCKPLVKYELSITRQIRNKHHCAVCNLIVDIDEETGHYDSDSHENNLLSAINKVSDFIDEDTKKDNDISVGDLDDSSDNISDLDADDEDCDNEWVKAVAENPGASYANVLKKTYNAPEYYDVNLDSKILRVTFDCWHMIIKPKKNSFYCMVCREYYHITTKNQHCASIEHLDKLNQCPIVHKFEKHFVRQVDDLYHCGHCNSLQLKNDIEDHLQFRHERKPRNVSENAVAPPKPNADASAKEMINPNHEADTKTGIGMSPSPSTSEAAGQMDQNLLPGVFVKYFNYIICLPFFNYHVITEYYNAFGLNYICGLCNVIFTKGSLLAHVRNMRHKHLLKTSPFLIELTTNMIRSVNGALHCGLCNTFILNSLISIHIQDPHHMQLLRNSLKKNTVNDNIAPTTSTNASNNVNKVNPPHKSSDLIDENKVINKNKTGQVKNGEIVNAVSSKEISNVGSDSDSTESIVDFESTVYVKHKKVYLKINYMSYNTLVRIGDGRRYCFVCSTKLRSEQIKRHVESRSHKKNNVDCYFLDLYEEIPLRQMYTTFHCAICNVLMSRSNIKDHLVWTTHKMRMEESKLPKKTRKNEVNSGTPVYVVKVDKEITYEHTENSVYKILHCVDIVDESYKMIQMNDNILKLPLTSWHGLVRVKEGYKCVVCQMEIKDEYTHVKSQEHDTRTQRPFLKEHLGDLLREVNSNILHCVICNVELTNICTVISNHIEGKRHKKNYRCIRESSINAENYTDCDGDLIQL